MIYAASNTFRAVGWVTATLLLVGWIVYLVVNIRQSRPEIGSEIELAANRRPPPDDEEFEGPRLEKVQAWGVAFLAITVIALPVYWLLEPGRQAGASRGVEETEVSRGEIRFEQSCSSCHGANLAGGVANPQPIIEIPDAGPGGSPLKVKVNWEAPSLNDVFKRFDTDITEPTESTEVRQIITYGRAPVMPAWGLAGGGSFNEQEVEELLVYLWDEQISDEEAQDDATEEYLAARADPANEDKSDGELLFEQNCARCHTPNWPARGAQVQDDGTIREVPPGHPGEGRYGPALVDTTLTRLFPEVSEQVDFVSSGSDDNVPFGDPASGIARGGGYGMPGFGRVLSEEQITAIVEYERSLTQDVDPTYGEAPIVAAEPDEDEE